MRQRGTASRRRVGGKVTIESQGPRLQSRLQESAAVADDHGDRRDIKAIEESRTCRHTARSVKAILASSSL